MMGLWFRLGQRIPIGGGVIDVGCVLSAATIIASTPKPRDRAREAVRELSDAELVVKDVGGRPSKTSSRDEVSNVAIATKPNRGKER